MSVDRFTDEGLCATALTEDERLEFGVRSAEPFSSDGETSCYYSMTPSDSEMKAGYIVSLFKSEASLLSNADATGALPVKAVPLSIRGRPTAKQVLFGDQWSASLTIDIGAGAFLHVSRYGPAHAASETALVSDAQRAAETALENLGSA